jgi:hypothetical protein
MPGMTRFPPRGPDLPDCMDLSFDLGIGELAPGHQVIARGICLHDGGLVLHYEFGPGLTAGETYRNLSQFSFTSPTRPTLLLPKTSSMLVGADAWVRPMLCAMAAGGALVLQGNAVAW